MSTITTPPIHGSDAPRRFAEAVRPSGAWALRWAERGAVPDWLIRLGIRRLLRARLAGLTGGTWADRQERKRALIDRMNGSDVAVHTDEANGQHYELPPAFFETVLGPHRKYSSGYWPAGVDTLEASEAAALDLVERRARLADGQRILELGCGWGSLTLWMARRLPGARITAVSNSAPQRRFILAKAADEGLSNLEVITEDINRFRHAPGEFDRVVSIEMFEHTRNWRQLFERVGTWLKPEGLLFLHVFTHRSDPYFFETEGRDDWMGRFFFTGGLMPSDDLVLHFQQHLCLADHWVLDGMHYARTARQWLVNQDRHRQALLPLLAQTYGSNRAARLWWQRWRIFWMACEELWGYRKGREWGVSHYLLRPR